MGGCKGILVGRPWPYSTAQPHAALLGAVDASRPNCRVPVIGAYPPARRGLSLSASVQHTFSSSGLTDFPPLLAVVLFLSSRARAYVLVVTLHPHSHAAITQLHAGVVCFAAVATPYGLARYKSITNAATSSAFEDVVPTTLPFSVIVSQSFFHDQLVRRCPRGRR